MRVIVCSQNEAEVCDVLCSALASMLKDREGPCLSHASSNGPTRGQHAVAASEEVVSEDGQEEAAPRVVDSEDRRTAVELLRRGEERVLRKCLEWVEVRG